MPSPAKLIDIESITGNEAAVGDAIARELAALGYSVERMPVEGDRFNVWATHLISRVLN